MMKKFGQTPKKIIGIDYSLNSPAVCVVDETFKFENCQFSFLTNKKKYTGKIYKNIIGYEIKDYKDQSERYKNLSDFVLTSIGSLVGSDAIFIEGYSYGSKGQAIFQIAENGGILKYRLTEQKLDYGIIVPSVVKKLATGKGNADKEKMYQAFKEETKKDLMKIFDMQTLNNPVTDIIDSYYIAKAGYESIES